MGVTRDKFVVFIKYILITEFFMISCTYCFSKSINGIKHYNLSLEDAAAIAIKNNKYVQIQERQVRIAKAQILNATSRFLPRLNINTGYKYNDAVLGLNSVSTVSLSQAFTKDVGMFTGYKNEYDAGATVRQAIYTGGVNISNLRKAQLNLTLEEQTLRARKLEIEFETKRLFYGLLLAYKMAQISEDLLHQAEKHYEDVAKKFKQGTASKFDLLQSKVQVAKTIPKLVRSLNSIDLIMVDLKKLLSLNMEDDVKIKGILTYLPFHTNEYAFLQEAYQNNPHMIIKKLGIDISKWEIKYEFAGYLPKITGNIDYSYKSNKISHMFNQRHNIWSVGIAAKIKLFDGFSTKAKVDAAKEQYAQAKLKKENLIDEIAVEVKRGCLDIKKAEAIIFSQKSSVAEAREAFHISEVSYDSGVGTNLDVLDALVSVSQVRTTLAEGIYDYYMAKAFLEKTLGRQLLKGRQS